MQKLIIKNFGPIKDVELEIKDFMVFIGPQASGKSTISKIIYFFQTISEMLIEKIVNQNILKKKEVSIKEYKIEIIERFLKRWSLNKPIQSFVLQYYFSNEIFIKIYTNNKIINVEFSRQLENKMNDSIQLQKQIIEGKSDIAQMLVIFLKKSIKDAFNQNQFQEYIYVPAGRSALISRFVDYQISSIQEENNLFIEKFTRLVMEQKNEFGRGLDIIPLGLDEEEWYYKSIFDLAKSIVIKILKGEYEYTNEFGDRILLENNEYVHLKDASSGQQEAIWILYLLCSKMIPSEKTDITIEEPEAHLYPEAQKDMIDLIALLFNTAENQVILTTHSPYILASINNLLYANKVGKNNEEKVNQIIDKKLWLDYNRFDAFFVESGVIRNIMDEEFQMIKNEAIDSASRIINQQFDDLYEFDN